jgi:ribosomal-protein-alanine N-acetyltransferase
MNEPFSPRLRFRVPDALDFDTVYRLQSDPKTMRYIRDPEHDPELTRARMRHWAQYREENPGRGFWMLDRVDSGAAAGFCLLRTVQFLPGNDLEIGYILAPSEWGQGLATEAAQALLNYARVRFDPPRVVAFTDPNHHRSQNVLLKCGFEPAGIVSVYAEEDAYFVKNLR